MSRHGKLLSYAQLREAVVRVTQIDKDAVLIGGFALNLYGSSRLTTDLDTIVERVPDGFENEKRLSFGGVRTTVNSVPVDFIERNDDAAPLYEAAYDHATKLPSIPLLVARPEYLLAMKMYAGRKKDEADIEWMLRAKIVDRHLAEQVVKKFLGVLAAKDLRLLFELTDWMATRPEAADED